METAMHAVMQTVIGQVQPVPLSLLVRSKLNVRKKEGSDIDDLAARIHAQGLLQNLVGFEQRKKNKETGKIEIVAGGRRLDALQLLATAELIAADYPVSCKIVDEADAVAVSLSENIGREPLHPADEFVAFGELVNRGHSQQLRPVDASTRGLLAVDPGDIVASRARALLNVGFGE